ncbi:MAG: NADH-quinone oxidoreductase subunit M [Saprospirales bacterium]|nr:NADH-quinone oxidoreductase subunit M [Saprospirales bacterium]
MLVLLLLILPVLFVPILLLFSEKQSKNIALVAALTEMCVGFFAFYQYQINPTCACFNWNTIWIQNLNANFHLQLNGINSVLVLLTTLIVPFIIQSTFERDIKNIKAYLSLMLMMQTALVGVFLAQDALLFYIFWELALIPIYLICLVFGGENRQKITFKFFVYTLFGSLFMLLAIIYVWIHTENRSFDIHSFYKAGALLTAKEQLFVFIAFYLAFAIKIPIFPLHTWQPDTYVNAPTQGTMLLSGIMLKMGTYALIIWLIPVVPLGWQQASKYVIILSVISVVYGSLMALTQHNFKRMLAYSSIGHVGLIAAGIFTMNLQGVQGAMYQMLSHGINVVALFFVCDIITNRMKTDEMHKLGGIRNVSRVFSVLFLIILLGSVALPLTNGFVGEFLLLHGLFQYNTVVVVFAGLTVILGALYMLRAYQLIMHGDTNALTESFGVITVNEKILLACFAGLIIFFGLFPNLILDGSENQIKQIIDHVHEVTAMVVKK